MTMARKRFAAGLVGLIALGVAAAAGVAGQDGGRASGTVREIRLVVRNMTYYVEGDSQPNPTLQLHRGEQVSLRLRNDDRGMIHDFAVAAWNIGTPSLAAGEEARLDFTVPDAAGAAAYACTPHGQIMRGTMMVE